MHKNSGACSLLAILWFVVLLSGCQQADNSDRFPTTTVVSGMVTWDGKPLEKGTIQFTSSEDTSRGSEAFAEITDGKYQAHVTQGKKQVLVMSLKPVGKADETGFQNMKDIIPPKYNQRTTLEAEIPAETFQANFDLTK